MQKWAEQQEKNNPYFQTKNHFIPFTKMKEFISKWDLKPHTDVFWQYK